MSGISEKKYEEVLKYVIALEESDSISSTVVEFIRFVLPCDVSLYIRLEKNGVIKEAKASYDEREKYAFFEKADFCLKDPLFDLGNRASGMYTQETHYVDLNTIPKREMDRYQYSLFESGITNYIVMSVSGCGDGLRVYRSGSQPKFTEEELAVADTLAKFLRKFLACRIDYEDRKEHFMSQTYSELAFKHLPFGTFFYNAEFELLEQNQLGLKRILDITGERTFNDSIRQFTPMVRDLVNEMKANNLEMAHKNAVDKYIVEVNVCGAVNKNDVYEEYYSVNIYSFAWFSNYAVKSIDEVLAKCGLTNREMELAVLIVKGCSNKEIATRLVISLNTVKDHIKSIFKKMQVSSRGELIIKLLVVQNIFVEGENSHESWNIE